MKSKSLFSGFIFIIILVIGLVWARAEFNPANFTMEWNSIKIRIVKTEG